MPNLDLQYVTELVRHAKEGDSNAFGELFAATYQKQYQFCFSYLQDAYLSQEALQQTYIQALKDLSRLNDDRLVIAWLTQLNFGICLKIRQRQDPDMPRNDTAIEVIIAGRRYTLHQVRNLPFTESQVLLLKWFCGLSNRRIASLMELKQSHVRDYMASGLARLPRPLEGEAAK